MQEQIELTDLDMRYEGCSLRSPVAEKALLNSILENGIKDPLTGVAGVDSKILLDGFKRCRCARKLNIGVVPWICVGTDEIGAIVRQIRLSSARRPNLIEQAAWIDELKNSFGMSGADIAGLLEKSPAWVSVRSGIADMMSERVRSRIFKGEFPAWSFLYTLRKFTRVNGVGNDQIERFVECVAGRKLSVRDISVLAEGWFKGSDEFRRQMEEGNVLWCLDSLKKNILLLARLHQRRAGTAEKPGADR